MKAQRVKKLDPEASLPENAARIVRVRLDELRSFAPQALEPGRAKAQHDMRIAAKRLRYVLEATEFCFGKPGETARRRARDLQDLLGELHDCDVMLPRVDDQLAELRSADAAIGPRAARARLRTSTRASPRRARIAPAYRGLEVLAVYLEARRMLLFDRFRELWAEQERKGTWDRLERGGRAPARRGARAPPGGGAAAVRAARELERAERAARAAAARGRQAAAELAAARRASGAARMCLPTPSRDPTPSRPTPSRSPNPTRRQRSRRASRSRAASALRRRDLPR